MSQDNSPSEGHVSFIIPVEIIKDDSSNNATATSLAKTLQIESFDETYYPTVSIIRTKPATKTTASTDLAEKLTRQRRNRGFRLWGSRLSAFATIIIALVAVAFLGTKLAGFKAFTVMSGSMEPDYPVGSMIYVKPTDYRNLKVGDVISYVANNEKTIVTHRIVDIETDKADSSVLRFITQGDANTSPDAKPVHYKNVLGTPIVVIPHLGYIAHNIQRPPGIYIALVVGTLLLAWTFLPGTLEERRKTARKSVA